MLILGIESSCDDTSVALIDASARGFKILAEKTASQIEIHKKYGGVVPEIAGRCHAEQILPLIEELLNHLTPHPSPSKGEGNLRPDVIAVTSGPGLITGLMVGVEAAKTLAYLWNIPVMGVNHIEGHIHSVEIQNSKKQETNNIEYPISNIRYPALALIASGGHTELILIKKQGHYKKIGATLDDAAGECFDKVAKLLGFDYPGGPKISKFAETGNPQAIKFPRPMLDKDNFDFSFAGLKTSALYWLRDHGPIVKHAKSDAKKRDSSTSLRSARNDIGVNDVCASFEQAIIDVLVGKTLKAVEKYQPKSVILAGGVSANKKLRKTLAQSLAPYSIFHAPSLAYAMDNAAMIAVAGYYHAIKKNFTPWQKLKADPEWEIA
ncbi:MAG: tRNA (adenosine(37)-N6)-threonylcarbamoyltransferase complex transferase subunit TsaD [Candidatus Magasanikbacteria bacterium]|nr:tRNA (adenosine(37)-N6)-threonylcarbamoyltransferase complex transferase subunit TsaD [Candidatus Magasanikbacteria bacterium]